MDPVPMDQVAANPGEFVYRMGMERVRIGGGRGKRSGFASLKSTQFAYKNTISPKTLVLPSSRFIAAIR